MSVAGIAAGVSAAAAVGGLAMSAAQSGDGPEVPAGVDQAMAQLLDNSNRQLDWFNRAYGKQWRPAQQKAAALADVVGGQSLALAGQAQDRSNQAWQRGLDFWGQWDRVFAPMVEQVATDARGWDGAQNLEKVAGEAAADTTRAAGLARARNRDTLARYGASPTGGRIAALESRAGIDEAAAAAGAMNQARENRRGQGFGMRMQAAGLGSGLLSAGNAAAGLAGNLAGQAAGFGAQAQQARSIADNYILQGAGLKRMGYNDANAALGAVINAGNQTAQTQNQISATQQGLQAQQMQGAGQALGTAIGYGGEWYRRRYGGLSNAAEADYTTYDPTEGGRARAGALYPGAGLGTR